MGRNSPEFLWVDRQHSNLLRRQLPRLTARGQLPRRPRPRRGQSLHLRSRAAKVLRLNRRAPRPCRIQNPAGSCAHPTRRRSSSPRRSNYLRAAAMGVVNALMRATPRFRVPSSGIGRG